MVCRPSWSAGILKGLLEEVRFGIEVEHTVSGIIGEEDNEEDCHDNPQGDQDSGPNWQARKEARRIIVAELALVTPFGVEFLGGATGVALEAGEGHAVDTPGGHVD